MVKKTVLSNGLTVISEYYPRVPSFALSYTFKNGSGIENVNNNGIHHLIEHMIFKGSKKYTLKNIASVSDRLGGQLNAFTGKEITQFYLKAVDDKLEESFDLLTDIVFNSKFDVYEFKKEMNVILQEIKESEDDPDSYAFDLFYKNSFKLSGIGLPITGSVDSVSSLTRDDVFKYYKENYIPENVILSCVGNIEHDVLMDLVRSNFETEVKSKPRYSFPIDPGFLYNFNIKKREDLNQLYSIIGFNGISAKDPEKYKYLIYNDILGSGMSSRLFQSIREDKGLAYTVSSFLDTYRDYGFQLIYSVMESENFPEYYKTVTNEMNKLKETGVKADEFENSKDHLKSSLILSLESNLSKMRFNVNQEIYYNRELDIHNIISRINSIDLEEFNLYLTEKINPEKNAILLYGAVGEIDINVFTENR